MPRVRHHKRQQIGPGWRLSTARSATQSARLGERLFPSTDRPFAAPDERIIANFEEAIRQAFNAGPQNGSPASSNSSAAPTDIACYSKATLTYGGARNDRVVFFASGPVTEADLHRERLKLSAAIRHHHRRRKRFAWLTDNAGTITLIAFLLA